MTDRWMGRPELKKPHLLPGELSLKWVLPPFYKGLNCDFGKGGLNNMPSVFSGIL